VLCIKYFNVSDTIRIMHDNITDVNPEKTVDPGGRPDKTLFILNDRSSHILTPFDLRNYPIPIRPFNQGQAFCPNCKEVFGV